VKIHLDASQLGTAEKLLRKVGRQINRELMRQLVVDFAERTHARLTRGIKEQTFALTPLSRRYLEQKIACGYDRRILIRSGDYLNAIRVRTTARSAAVEVNPNSKTDTGIPMNTLALWLEYGTRRMPARPHWRPTALWAQYTWYAMMEREITRRVRGLR